MKATENTNASSGPLTQLVGAAAGALTATLAAKLLDRPRPAKRRRASQPRGAKPAQPTPQVKGGGRHG